MNEVLFILGLKKNLLSISALDNKGYQVAFIAVEVLVWPKGMSLEDAIMIGIEEGGFYKLKGKSNTTLTYSTINPCELWHRRLAHINYKALPMVSKVVTGLLEIQVNRDVEYAKDVLEGRM